MKSTLGRSSFFSRAGLWLALLPALLLLAACHPKGTGPQVPRSERVARDQVLRAALEVMKNEVNEHVEENQDVKMEFDANKCTCRYFVGKDFASAEMRWTMRLPDMDVEQIRVVQEDGMTRVEMFTIDRRDEIMFEEGEMDPLTVNEFNLYLSPNDAEAPKRFTDALTTAISRCKQQAN